MHKKINNAHFHDAFYAMGRQNHFSYNGLNALFDYLEENFPDMELDVIDLCCSYSEYESLEEYNIDNNTDHEDIKELNRERSVIDIDGQSFIVNT